MRKIKKCLLYFSFALLVATSWNVSAAGTNLSKVKSSGVSIAPYADDIRWVYVTMDGIQYRRKYNYSRQCWVGDWELVP